ncbi:hypothetical protein [Mesorhizobium wenxiniae]|uniref:hypothetical protein n=1 Tax=Mesorhizobium wenxiniae TaxID=2014805 RepID=UPI001055B315|nr:hypothetical protein [Mesorhizobium wenxiniae]
MSQLQPLPSTASHAHGLHGHLDGFHDSASRHDEPCHNDQIDGPGIVVEGPLLGIEGEAKVAVAQVFGLCKAGAENIRHNGRFDQKLVQGCPPEWSVVYDQSSRDHQPFHGATFQSVRAIRFAQSVTKHGSQQVNACVANPEISMPAAERLSQIADQSATYAIRQDQTRNDPVFLGMGDPSNQANIAVDPLDVDALNERVGNDDRLGQRRVFVIVGRHSNLQGAAS